MLLPGEWKPVLAALVLPPAAPLLLALLGGLVALRRRGAGLVLAFAGIALAWMLSTHGMGLLLARQLLPAVAPLQTPALLRVQAIVVLGAGVLPQAPEYAIAQPHPHTLARLRYGAWLARHSGKPLAFAGGVGWAAAGTRTASEATVAQRVLKEEYGLTLQWLDDRSRDTAENAARVGRLLRKDKVQRIALVTDATHMPRAAAAFRAEGFEVLPAPTNFPVAHGRPVLEWLPSDEGVTLCRQVLREWLARAVEKAA